MAVGYSYGLGVYQNWVPLLIARLWL